MIRHICIATAILLFCERASMGDVIEDLTPGTLVSQNSGSSDFLGVVSGGVTASSGTAGVAEIANGVTVNVESLGGDIGVNDVIGRDLSGTGFNFTSGDAVWDYELALPANAQSGTGLSGIIFTADLFVSGGTFESADDMHLTLFINGASNTTLTAEAQSPGPISISPTSVSDLVTSVALEVRINQSGSVFETGTESFAFANASLQANFIAVPEPSSLACFLVGSALVARRRRRV